MLQRLTRRKVCVWRSREEVAGITGRYWMGTLKPQERVAEKHRPWQGLSYSWNRKGTMAIFYTWKTMMYRWNTHTISPGETGVSLGFIQWKYLNQSYRRRRKSRPWNFSAVYTVKDDHGWYCMNLINLLSCIAFHILTGTSPNWPEWKIFPIQFFHYCTEYCESEWA